MTGIQRAAAWGAVVVVVAGVGAVPVAAGGLAAGENEAPLADAGLDQEVPVNATTTTTAPQAAARCVPVIQLPSLAAPALKNLRISN